MRFVIKHVRQNDKFKSLSTYFVPSVLSIYNAYLYHSPTIENKKQHRYKYKRFYHYMLLNRWLISRPAESQLIPLPVARCRWRGAVRFNDTSLRFSISIYRMHNSQASLNRRTIKFIRLFGVKCKAQHDI